MQGAPTVWLRPARASAPRGAVTTGGGCALGTYAHTTASYGHRCDRCRSERAAATRPPSAKPVALAGGDDGRAALSRRRQRRQ